MTLHETDPLILGFAGVEDDLPLGVDIPGYAYKVWLPGGYQGSGTTRLYGTGGDSRCSGGTCFWVDVTVNVTKAPPPLANE